jgi:hypothetical protein
MPVGSVEKRALIVASTEALRTALHRHEVYVPGLRRWGDPNARLLNNTAWEAARSRVCEELDLSAKPDTILAGWTGRLDAAHREFADGLAANPAVRIEQQNGRDRIILTGLDRLDEPATLRELHKEVEARLPAVDLPEMVLEVDSWVPYLGDFTHVSEANSRMDDLELSMAAVLTAEATNVGVEPIVHDGVDALSRDRLFWVDYHMRLPLVQSWGGGELASADGLRFVTPINGVVHAGPPPDAGHGRGGCGAVGRCRRRSRNAGRGQRRGREGERNGESQGCLDHGAPFRGGVRSPPILAGARAPDIPRWTDPSPPDGGKRLAPPGRCGRSVTR